MSYFNIVAQSSESTVVTEYKPQSKRSEAYQSEADLEKEFIRLLCELGYEHLTIHKEADLIANLRTQLEKLNSYRFTDGEWKRFWDEVLANTNSGILEKTRLIQEDCVQVLRRDNGESKNIQLIDKKCIGMMKPTAFEKLYGHLLFYFTGSSPVNRQSACPAEMDRRRTGAKSYVCGSCYSASTPRSRASAGAVLNRKCRSSRSPNTATTKLQR